MAGRSTSRRPFRLLDLPAELRNRIYDYYFEDHAPETIPYIVAKHLGPQDALTMTCHQIRQESLQLHTQAMARYFTSHIFFIQLKATCDESIRAPPAQSYIWRVIDHIRSVPQLPIRNLQIWNASGKYTGDGYRPYVVNIRAQANGVIAPTWFHPTWRDGDYREEEMPDYPPWNDCEGDTGLTWIGRRGLPYVPVDSLIGFAMSLAGWFD